MDESNLNSPFIFSMTSCVTLGKSLDVSAFVFSALQ